MEVYQGRRTEEKRSQGGATTQVATPPAGCPCTTYRGPPTSAHESDGAPAQRFKEAWLLGTALDRRFGDLTGPCGGGSAVGRRAFVSGVPWMRRRLRRRPLPPGAHSDPGRFDQPQPKSHPSYRLLHPSFSLFQMTFIARIVSAPGSNSILHRCLSSSQYCPGRELARNSTARL